MKVIAKTTFVVEKGKTVPPGTAVDIKDSEEAQSLIDRGLAELPLEKAPDANAGTTQQDGADA